MKGRVPEVVAGDVPAELLSLADPTWSSPALFADWLRRHDLGEPAAEGWYHRFCTGRDRWAAVNGFTYVTGGSGQRTRDDGRLKAAGVPFAGAIVRAMAAAGNPAPVTPFPYPLSAAEHRAMLAARHAEHT